MVTACEIKKALFAYFNYDEWAVFDELRLSTGWVVNSTIDFFAMNLWPSKKYEKLAMEIKVSRSDFSREKSNLLKSMPSLSICDKFYFVAPVGLLTIDDVPKWARLWEYDPTTKKMLDRPYCPVSGIGSLFVPSMAFVASILNRQAKKERAERNMKVDNEKA